MAKNQKQKNARFFDTSLGRAIFIFNALLLIACYWSMFITDPAEDVEMFKQDIISIVEGIIFIGFFCWLFLIHNYKKE